MLTLHELSLNPPIISRKDTVIAGFANRLTNKIKLAGC